MSDSGAYFQADEAGERDPMGVAFGPPTLLFPAEGLPDEGGPSVRYGAGVPNGQCTLDGMTVDCADANQLMRHGLLAHAPDEMVRFNDELGRLESFQAYADGFSGFMPRGATYEGRGRWAFNQGGGDPNDPDVMSRPRRVRNEFAMGYNFFASLPLGYGLPGTSSAAGDRRRAKKASFDVEKLKECLKTRFKTRLGPSDGRTTAFDTAKGKFVGFFGQSDILINITIDDKSMTLGDIQKRLPNAMAYADRKVMGTVYIGSDAFKDAVPEYRIAAQLHEVGNKIAQLFETLFEEPEASRRLQRLTGDDDAGLALEECVFGGYVNKDGTILR